jgi:hypothetical protein
MNEEQAGYAIELLEYIAKSVQVVKRIAQAAAAKYDIRPLIDPFEPKIPSPR